MTKRPWRGKITSPKNTELFEQRKRGRVASHLGRGGKSIREVTKDNWWKLS